MEYNIDTSKPGSTTCTTEDEIRKSGGIIFDPTRGITSNEDYKFPDATEMLCEVEKIMEYMCTDEMIAMKAKDSGEYMHHMETRFEVMANKHFGLFRMIVNGDNLDMFFTMMEYMDKVNRKEIEPRDAEAMMREQEFQPRFVRESTVDDGGGDGDCDAGDDSVDGSDNNVTADGVDGVVKKKKRKRKRKKKK